MNDESTTELLDNKNLISSYFPDYKHIKPDDDRRGGSQDEVLCTKKKILPYLQTIFFEEHVVEVQPDFSTRIYFSQIVDNTPDTEIDEEEDMLLEEIEYEPGSYLKEMSNFLLIPVTPGIGNSHVRQSSRLIVRFFSGTTSIELGCKFFDQYSVQNTPVLRISYPEVVRINKNFRSYRTKIIDTVDAKVIIDGEKIIADTPFLYQLIDFSGEGMAFQVPSGHPSVNSGDLRKFTIVIEGKHVVEVYGIIRHITKIREKKGHKNVCGVQFDLESRALATELESLASNIQRMHLRELAEKTAEINNITLIR